MNAKRRWHCISATHRTMILVLVMLLGSVVGGGSPATAASISALGGAAPATVTRISALADALSAPAAHISVPPGCNADVTFKAKANGKYVTVEKNYTGSSAGMLRARADTIGSWQQFDSGIAR